MAKVSPIIVFIPLLLGAFLKLCCMEAPANHTVPQEKLSDDILNDIEEQLLLNCGLIGSVLERSADSVVFYLQLGADINFRDPRQYNNTALHLAIMCDNFAITCLLLESKAKTTIRNKKKQTALDLATAIESSTRDIVEYYTQANFVGDILDIVSRPNEESP